jgi:septum formation protein
MLLEAAGWICEVRPPDIDESALEGEHPAQYVARLAAEKLAAVAGTLVLAADTTVDLDGVVLGKPADHLDAANMLRQLSGQTHQVHTAVAVRRTDAVAVEVATTTVEFVELSEQEIRRYVDSGEPLDKAGAYAIQGSALGFVARLDGSLSNVVGLPMHVVRRLLGP